MTVPTDRPPPSGTDPGADPGAWILRSRALLDASVRDVDGATRSRLQRARNAALQPAQAPDASPRTWAWAGTAAVIAGVALMLARLLPLHEPAAVSAPVAGTPPVAAPAPRLAPAEDTPLAAPDFDLLLDADDTALLDELEFYAWLDEDAGNDG